MVGLHDDRLTVRGIKMSIDGALGSRGAALLEEYADDAGNTGLFRLTDDEIYETILRGLRAGYQTTTHAIGDAANRTVLDAMTRALAEAGVDDARLRVEHAQILDADDVSRFAELGVIPSMQPTHATTDMHWAADRLGEARTEFAYAWRSLLDSGVPIAGGSDAPVESVQPLLGIFAAVTRQDLEGWPEGGWHPEQLVTREEALRMFTYDAAYSVFRRRPERLARARQAGRHRRPVTGHHDDSSRGDPRHGRADDDSRREGRLRDVIRELTIARRSRATGGTCSSSDVAFCLQRRHPHRGFTHSSGRIGQH